MEISITTRQAYSEIDEFLSLLTEEQRKKIPKKLRDFFREEKDNNYIKEISVDIPVNQQNFKEETLAIIALLNLQYWCQDEDEKQRLRSIYANNEKVYQEMLKEKYNPNNLFKVHSTNEKTKENSKIKWNSMIQYKESFFKKILNKLKRLFKINR